MDFPFHKVFCILGFSYLGHLQASLAFSTWGRRSGLRPPACAEDRPGPHLLASPHSGDNSPFTKPSQVVEEGKSPQTLLYMGKMPTKRGGSTLPPPCHAHRDGAKCIPV